MAKDDYEVVLYRLLVYLYACMKRKIVYDDATFRAAVLPLTRRILARLPIPERVFCPAGKRRFFCMDISSLP